MPEPKAARAPRQRQAKLNAKAKIKEQAGNQDKAAEPSPPAGQAVQAAAGQAGQAGLENGLVAGTAEAGAGHVQRLNPLANRVPNDNLAMAAAKAAAKPAADDANDGPDAYPPPPRVRAVCC